MVNRIECPDKNKTETKENKSEYGFYVFFKVLCSVLFFVLFFFWILGFLDFVWIFVIFLFFFRVLGAFLVCFLNLCKHVSDSASTASMKTDSLLLVIHLLLRLSDPGSGKPHRDMPCVDICMQKPWIIGERDQSC